MSRTAVRTAAALFSVILSGCFATVQTLDGESLRISSAAFREYAETVFREQNRLASVLVFRIEEAEPDPGSLESLEDAEAELLAACRDLNEVAVRRRDRERRRLFADARAAKSVPECERAVDAVGRVLSTR